MDDAPPPNHIMLVEDHASFRQALAFAFNLDPELHVHAEAGSLSEAQHILPEVAPEVTVAVFDLDLPDGDGASLIPPLHRANAHATALVLTGSTDPKAHARVIHAGAAGYMHKSAPLTEIVDTVKRAAAGEPLISTHELLDISVASRRLAPRRATAPTVPSLTRRERDVLDALAHGLNDQEIADRLFVSKETVRTHMERIMRKLGAGSRTQALIVAIRLGLVNIA